MRDRTYTLAELKALPTLAVGQADDLKVEKHMKERVWLSRCGPEDGEPYRNKVTIERYNGKTHRWEEGEHYQAH